MSRRTPRLHALRARYSPFALALSELSRGVGTPRDTLTYLFGGAFAARVIDLAVRARFEDARSEVRRPTKRGGTYAPPGTVRVPVADAPIRSELSAPVWAMAVLLVAIAARLRPGRRRTGGAALYLGDPSGRRVCGLAAKTGRSARELERYLALLRHQGVLSTWQPPARDTDVPKSRKGHAYNVYQFEGELPRELVTHVDEWGAHLARQQQLDAQKAIKVRPPPPPAAPLVVSQADRLAGAAMGASFLELLKSRPPAS